MSTENKQESIESQNVEGPQLSYMDIINATKIMEAAIERKAFSIKELAEVAPIVSRFQDFSQTIIEENAAQNAPQAAEKEGE